MARKLQFTTEHRTFEFVISKIDRAKLYGHKEVIAVDPGDQPLNKGYLDEWGSVVINSTGMGYLDSGRRWRGKSELVAVDLLGNQLEMIPSSFDAPIPLEETASLEDFCEYEVTSVYGLDGFELEDFAEILTSEKGLFRFNFNYRPGYEPKTAFLQSVGEKVYMLIGVRTELELLVKPQRTEVEDFDEDDDLDFSMM